MSKLLLLLLVPVLLLAMMVPAYAGTRVSPTTTLAAESGNNTSAADSFTTQSNGNYRAGNVSRVSHRELLYPGSNAKIYAHFMPWFGGSNHMNVGYRSDDPEQVRRQVADMRARGIDGAIVNWYGPNFTRENNSTLALMRESELHSNFEFAVMEDVGALMACKNTSGCDVTAETIRHLNYAAATYFPSAAYMRMGGRPVVFFFGTETLNIDWNRVRAGVSGDPLLVQRNAGGFNYLQSDGAYGWVAPESVTLADPMALQYLDHFYGTALVNPLKLPFGSTYPGFDDRLAAWSKNFRITQGCGRTWLATWEKLARYYTGSADIRAIQLVTWNDYEEGTEIESGVDNCVTVSPAMNGSTLSWSISGDERTVHHYEVFISADGQNLMKLHQVPAGTRALDLASYDLEPGLYSLYVKAVGMPSITNKMSAAVSFGVSRPDVNIAAPTDAATVIGPVRVVATSIPNGAAITATQIYVDDVLTYETTSADLDTTLALAPGTHRVVVKAWDAFGASAMKTATVQVEAVVGSVTIHSPAQGQSLQSPVRLTATSTSNAGIQRMRAFADGALVYEVAATSLDVYLNLAAGTRVLTVVADDAAGQTYTESVTITVKFRRRAVRTESWRAGGASAQQAAPSPRLRRSSRE